jgi:hypothetical protein
MTFLRGAEENHLMAHVHLLIRVGLLLGATTCLLLVGASPITVVAIDALLLVLVVAAHGIAVTAQGESGGHTEAVREEGD